jgi:hypothetical protein
MRIWRRLSLTSAFVDQNIVFYFFLALKCQYTRVRQLASIREYFSRRFC